MTPVQPIVRFEDNFFWLSNFYERPVQVGQLTFLNAEAAFQGAKYKAAKCKMEEKHIYLEKMLNAKPQEAKNLGRRIPLDLDKWEEIKVQCMRDVVKAKFDTAEDLRIKLIETGAALLVEGNTWKDFFWGRCEGKGLNVLGSILMELRGYYFWTEHASVDW